MKFAIEHWEVNPHTRINNGNSNCYVSYIISMRWKTIIIIEGTEKFAINLFKKFGNNYRLKNYDTNEIVRRK